MSSNGAVASSSTSSILRSSSPASASTRQLSDRRLFVSNLAPQVIEHDLLRLFQPFGTLRKLDLIFHRSGPQKGRPKGYAFVELAEKEEAEKARQILNGKAVKGREIHISYASVSQEQASGPGPHRKRRIEDPARPTTLSLVKNLKRNDSTDARIAAMEAKLSAIKQRTEQASEGIKGGSSTSLLKGHPSLPAKPRLFPAKPGT